MRINALAAPRIIGLGTRKRLRVNNSGNSSNATEQPSRSPVSPQVLGYVRQLREAIKDLRPLGVRFQQKNDTTVVSAQPPAVASQSVVNFGTSTAARLQSIEQINATETSFTPIAPAWVGSTANPSISGIYTGIHGTGRLTFRVDMDGVHGQSDLKIKVYSPSGSFIQDVQINKEDPIDKQYLLNNGLVLQLGTGSLVKNTEFYVDVAATVPTSYSPTQPPWVGSTATVALSGAYSGSYGTGALTFKVDLEGIHGQDDLKIKVFAPNQILIEEININREDPINKVYTSSTGLTLTLSAGKLIKNESFTVQVNHQVANLVDPDKPFNGTGNNNPNLQYGFSVGSGSFTINGVTINVQANDTINSVLSRITQSAADVTAVFDPVSEAIKLTRKTPGLTKTITFGSDSSGFLNAMKLTGAVASVGDGNKTTPLVDVQSFASIQSGTIYVNETAISIDRNTDSLQGIVQRINSLVPGITMSIDDAAKRVTIVGQASTDQIVLDSNGTGFFSALAIADDAYLGVESSTVVASPGGVSRGTTIRIGSSLNRAARALNGLFEQTGTGEATDESLQQLRAGVRDAIAKSFHKNGTMFETTLGVNFDFRPEAGEVQRFNEADQRRLLNRLKSAEGSAEFHDLFYGDGPNDPGLVRRLTVLLAKAERDLAIKLGKSGQFVDALA